MGQNAVRTFEETFAGWRSVLLGAGLDVAESQHQYWLTATHPQHPERGVLHVRLVIVDDDGIASGIEYWAATQMTQWEQLRESGASTVFGILRGTGAW